MLWAVPGGPLGLSPRRCVALFTLHTAVLAAAAAIRANSSGRGHHPGPDQPGNHPAERFPANGAAVGDPLDLYGAVLCRHLGRT